MDTSGNVKAFCIQIGNFAPSLQINPAAGLKKNPSNRGMMLQSTRLTIKYRKQFGLHLLDVVQSVQLVIARRVLTRVGACLIEAD